MSNRKSKLASRRAGGGGVQRPENSISQTPVDLLRLVDFLVQAGVVNEDIKYDPERLDALVLDLRRNEARYLKLGLPESFKKLVSQYSRGSFGGSCIVDTDHRASKKATDRIKDKRTEMAARVLSKNKSAIMISLAQGVDMKFLSKVYGVGPEFLENWLKRQENL